MAQTALLRLLGGSLASYILPSFLVRLVLTLFYRATGGRVQPRPSHAILAHSLVVLSYIAYTLHTTYSQLPVNVYDLLDVVTPAEHGGLDTGSPPSPVDSWKDTVLRPRWLSLVKTYHPDKLGGTEAAQEYFRRLQGANEILKNDTLRTVYHKFGPEFLQGLASLKPSELTLRNLVTRGVLSSVAWYIVAALIFIVMPVLTSSPNKKVFWRLSSLLLLGCNELVLVSSPNNFHHVPLLSRHTALTYELVTMLRQVWFTFNLALSQLPILSNDKTKREKPETVLLNSVAPLMNAARIRNDMSTQHIEVMLRRELSKTTQERDVLLDRLVEGMLSG